MPVHHDTILEVSEMVEPSVFRDEEVLLWIEANEDPTVVFFHILRKDVMSSFNWRNSFWSLFLADLSLLLHTTLVHLFLFTYLFWLYFSFLCLYNFFYLCGAYFSAQLFQYLCVLNK